MRHIRTQNVHTMFRPRQMHVHAHCKIHVQLITIRFPTMDISIFLNIHFNMFFMLSDFLHCSHGICYQQLLLVGEALPACWKQKQNGVIK